MPLEAAFQSLYEKCRRLHDIVNVQVIEKIVLEEEPLRQLRMVGDLGDELIRFLAAVEPMQQAAGEARKAASHPVDLESLRKALGDCQGHFHEVWEPFSITLMSREKIASLSELAKRGDQWQLWTDAIRRTLEQCPRPIYEIGVALALGWQEIAERGGGVTNIGQQIQVGKHEEFAREGIT